MTILGLNLFLKTTGEKLGFSMYKKIPLSTLSRGSRIAIDTSEFLYSYFAISKLKIFENDVTTRTFCNVDKMWKPLPQETIKYYVCRQFISLINNFKKVGMEPVFVFDGPHTESKQITKDERKRKYEIAKEKLEKVRSDPTDFDSYKKAITAVNVPEHYYKELLTQLFHLLHVSFYHSVGESDPLCSQLNKNGLVKAVLSQDIDQVAYNTPFIIKELKVESGIPYITYTNTKVIAACLNLSERQLVELCVMCGTDYNNNVKGYGPNKNIELMKKYGSIEKVIENESLFKDLDYKTTLNIFTTPISIPPINQCERDMKLINRDEFLALWTNQDFIGYFDNEIDIGNNLVEPIIPKS